MDDLRNKMWAVGGGKGGVGKSVVTLMLGAALARHGRRVNSISGIHVSGFHLQKGGNHRAIGHGYTGREPEAYLRGR